MCFCSVLRCIWQGWSYRSIRSQVGICVTMLYGTDEPIGYVVLEFLAVTGEGIIQYLKLEGTH